MGLWGQRKNLRLFKRRLLADSCYKPQPESKGGCCEVSSYSLSTIFNEIYNRTRPEGVITMS